MNQSIEKPNILSCKEAEKELIAEKERLETLGNNLPDGVLYQFVYDTITKQIRLTYVSGMWEMITGISAESAKSNIDTFLSILHPDDLSPVLQQVDSSSQSMTNFYAEFRISVQGRIRWMQMRSHPNRRDTTIVWDGIMLDITKRKDDVRELENEKLRLQALGDNLPGSALYQVSRDMRTGQMRILYVSGTWEAVSGVPAEVALASIQKVFDAIDPDYLPVVIQSIEASARTMTDYFIETRMCDRWIHLVARPRCEGAFIIWDGIITDVTEQKNREAELAAYREKLEVLVQERTNELKTANAELAQLLAANEYQLTKLNLVVEASVIGLWDMHVVKGDPINPNNTFIWSDDFRKMLGYSSEADFPNVLNSWSEKLHPEDKQRTLDAFARHLLDRTGKTPYNLKYRLLKKNGEYGWFHAFGATVRDEEGYALRVAGGIKDVM